MRLFSHSSRPIGRYPHFGRKDEQEDKEDKREGG